MQHRFLAALGLLALAGCAGDTGTVVRQGSAARPSPAAEARPAAAPVTTFDGRYTGLLTLNPDRTRECPAAPAEEREITVRQGRATFTVNPAVAFTQTGTVGAEGAVRMSGTLDRAIATTGLFTDGLFLGEYRNGRCSYAIRMTRGG